MPEKETEKARDAREAREEKAADAQKANLRHPDVNDTNVHRGDTVSKTPDANDPRIAGTAPHKGPLTGEDIVARGEKDAQEIINKANVEAQKARDDAAKVLSDGKRKVAGDLADKKVRMRADRDTLFNGVVTGAVETETGLVYDIQTDNGLFTGRLSPRAMEAGEFELVKEVK